MSQSTRILLSLFVGLALGVALTTVAPAGVAGMVSVAQPIGTAWLNALQMTVVPLVFALLVTGIAATAEAARAGAVAGRSIVLILIVMTLSSVAAAVLTPLMLRLVPLPAASGAALRAALGEVGAPATVPPLGDFLAGIVPSNALAAAANSNFLSLIVFTLVFAFAVTRIEASRRAGLIDFFTAIREAMLVMIGWMIWIAPVGVFALALVVGAKAGTAAFGALLHYVLIVSGIGIVVGVCGFPLAMLGGRIGLGRFVHAALPSQALAISTQSSLACLPAMLRGSEALGVPVAISGVVLPLSVAMMRATGPAMNLAVAIYVANWFGIEIPLPTMVLAVLVATLTSVGAVSLPGQVSFISSIAPVAVTLGVPLAPLGLLIAVETFPDIFRTLGNVTVDLAVTATVAARARAGARTLADNLLEESA